MKKKYDVAITTMNWNVTDLLQNCIDSVLKYCKNVNFQWFIVDNNSQDADFDEVVKKYSNNDRLILMKNSKNEGGMVENRNLKKFNSKYLLFLQPDVVLKSNAIGELIEFMERHDNVGGATPLFLNPDGTQQLYFGRLQNLSNAFYIHTGLGRIIDKNFLSYKHRREYRYLDYNFNRITEIDHVGCVCFITRLKFFLEDGYIHDKNFIFSHGDYDLCKRIKDKGYKIFLIPSIEIYHYLRSSLKKAEKEWWFTLTQRAQFKYVRKHHSKKIWLFKLLYIFENFMSLFSIKKKKSLKQIIGNIAKILII